MDEARRLGVIVSGLGVVVSGLEAEVDEARRLREIQGDIGSYREIIGSCLVEELHRAPPYLPISPSISMYLVEELHRAHRERAAQMHAEQHRGRAHMGRCREIWGDAGRYREIWGAVMVDAQRALLRVVRVRVRVRARARVSVRARGGGRVRVRGWSLASTYRHRM